MLHAASAGRPRFGSVRLRFGGGRVRAVPVFGSGGSSAKRGFAAFQHSLAGRDGSGFGFGSWKTVPAVPVPLSVSGKTVPTVPVSGSGLVPELPCDGKSLSIAKNHLKSSQEFSERFGPFILKMKGFSRNSSQKVHPNFAQNLGRQILGNTFSGP